MEFQLNQLGFEVEYITKKWCRRLGAVRLGNIRLIDNVLVDGAAARKAEIGDKIFIISYTQINHTETLEPIVIDLEH